MLPKRINLQIYIICWILLVNRWPSLWCRFWVYANRIWWHSLLRHTTTETYADENTLARSQLPIWYPAIWQGLSCQYGTPLYGKVSVANMVPRYMARSQLPIWYPAIWQGLSCQYGTPLYGKVSVANMQAAIWQGLSCQYGTPLYGKVSVANMVPRYMARSQLPIWYPAIWQWCWMSVAGHRQETKFGTKATRAPFQYKDHLSQVWGFPC